MVADLSAVGALNAYGQLRSVDPTGGATGGSIDTSSAQAAVDSFVQVFDNADAAVDAVAKGEGSAQSVVEAMAQAELALQTVVTIRDRVVEAYQEILRMPV